MQKRTVTSEKFISDERIDLTSTSMKIQNIFSMLPNDIFFSMNYSHDIKKVTNVLQRTLYLLYLLCQHTSLFTESAFLTSEAKMRNHSAEEGLNKELLHLMLLYSESLEDSSYLFSTTQLLHHTYTLISNFRDPRPMIDISGVRLKENIDSITGISRMA